MDTDERECGVAGKIRSQQRCNAGRQYRPDGGSVTARYLNDVWRSTDNGATWTQQNASAGWTGRERHTSVVLPDGSIVLMGGWRGFSVLYNDVWRSTDKGVTWTQQTAGAGWTGRQLPCSVVMPDGSIVLTGGYDGIGTTNDTWRSTDNGATWTEVNASAGWVPRAGHTSVVCRTAVSS